MKPVLLCLLASLGIACGDVIPEWVTLTGRHFKEVNIVDIKPDGLSIRHEAGVAKISFDDLTPEQRDKYHLTAEGRDNYVREQQENARLAHAAAKFMEADARRLKEEAAASKPVVVPYISPEDIKRDWATKLPMPGSLEKGYKDLVAKRNAALRAISSGSRDREAAKRAAEHNKLLALNAGDTARAALEEQTLARISKEELALAGYGTGGLVTTGDNPPLPVIPTPPVDTTPPAEPVMPPSDPALPRLPPKTPIPDPPEDGKKTFERERVEKV